VPVLSYGMTVSPITCFDAQALDAASTELGLRTVVLFGSHATLDPPPGPESDVDVAVSFASIGDAPSFWDAHEVLARAFREPLDLVLLVDTDSLFRWEIMSRGRLIWGDEIAHLEDRALAFRLFVDSADLRRLERTLFEKRMAYLRAQLRATT